jgi:DNA-binding NarL/FixJ family response regulator
VHALDLDEAQWTAAIFAEARQLFDDGLGTFVYTYTLEESVIRLGALAGTETAPAFWQALAAWGAQNAFSLAALYATGVTTLEETRRTARRRRIPLESSSFRRHGVADMLTISGHDAQGVGIFITLPHASQVSARKPQHRLELERLSFELSAMIRVREQQRRVRAARLSASEHRVAQRLLEGASDKEIALELRLSLSTVSTLVRRTRRKLGCEPGGEILALSVGCGRTALGLRLELFGRLTAAECDVASALLVGSSYADIAASRGVSERTVASQCCTVFRKCGVSGRRALAALLLGRVSGK